MKYFHSTDWGFDDNYQNKKIMSRRGLESLGLPMLSSFSILASDLDQVFMDAHVDTVYLVTVDDPCKEFPRQGYFNIMSSAELNKKIQRDFSNRKDVLSRCRCFFIEQIFPCLGCFTGVIISNGLGKIVCEIISDTIDNREITSGSTVSSRRKRIIYYDGKLCCCEDFYAWRLLVPYLQLCKDNLGYYEFSYGKVGEKHGVFFSYYSKDKVYQNIFEHDIPFYEGMITCRCIERAYLKSISLCE